MDKREFLSALEKSLSVLQEDELRDIVSEYEQHIDIKVAKGLTEEEAIEDFGSFSQLTAELLEAYHVRADYAAGGEKRKGGASDRTSEAGERNDALWAAVKARAARIGKGVRWTGRQVGRPFSWLGRKCRIHGGMFRGHESREPGGEEPVNTDNTGAGMRDRRFRPAFLSGSGTGERGRGEIHRRKKTGEMIIRRIGEGIAGMFRWLADGACFAVRIVWNGCWLAFSAVMAGFGMLCLYGLGVLAVLLAQGYPLAGVTLGCLGLVMCAFSAAVIGVTFLKKSRNGAWGNRHAGYSGRNRRKMMKGEEAGSPWPAGGVRGSGESVGRSPETGKGADKAADKKTGGEVGEEAGEESNRAGAEESRENQVRGYHRGGEGTWANCGA